VETPGNLSHGASDLVRVAEAPYDKSATAFELRMVGNVRATTMRACDYEELSRILQKLG
jgi:uncharacterized protein with GYD domain